VHKGRSAHIAAMDAAAITPWLRLNSVPVTQQRSTPALPAAPVRWWPLWAGWNELSHLAHTFINFTLSYLPPRSNEPCAYDDVRTGCEGFIVTIIAAVGNR
jgi:hypothetical protein